MTTPSSSPLPSASLGDDMSRTPLNSDDKPRQPRRPNQSKASGNQERTIPGPDKPSGPTNLPQSIVPSKLTLPSSTPSTKLPRRSPDGERARQTIDTPDDIKKLADPNMTLSAVETFVSTVMDTTTAEDTTPTTVEERKVTEVTRTEQPAVWSKASAGEQKQTANSPIQGSVSRRSSFSLKTRFPRADQAAQSAFTSSSGVSDPLTTPGVANLPSTSIHNIVQKEFVMIEHSRRGEMDHIINLMKLMEVEYNEHMHSWKNERAEFLREKASSAARTDLLRIQLGEGHPEDLEVRVATGEITTRVTTITTTITTIITRVEKWKHTVDNKNGLLTIPADELRQLSSILSTTSSQLNELQQQFDGLSKDFVSVHHQLQLTVSLGKDKDHTIDSLKEDVEEKAQQLSALRGDNEGLRRDLLAARDELKTKSTLIEGRDQTIASLKADVAWWEQSDAEKAKQIATIRQDYDKLQNDFAAATSRMSDFEKNYTTKSKDLSSIRGELQECKSLVEEKDGQIGDLKTKVEEWERVDAAKGEQIATLRRDNATLHKDLETFSSQTAELQKRNGAQSKELTSTRSELQAKTLLLEEKETAITSHATSLADAKREVSLKTEQLSAARREVEQLHEESSTISLRLADLQRRYDAQSQDLGSVRDELNELKLGDLEGKELSEHLTAALEEKNAQIQELRQTNTELTTQNTTLQESVKTLSQKMRTAVDEYMVKESQYKRDIAELASQVKQLEQALMTRTKQLATAGEEVEKLKKDLSVSTSQLSELQLRYKDQSGELIAVRKDLQDCQLTIRSKDSDIASTAAEVDRLKPLVTSSTGKIASLGKQVEDLQRNFSDSSSKFRELQGRYDTQSNQLITAREELAAKTLSHDNAVRSHASLTIEVEGLRRASATSAEQLATIQHEVDNLRQDLSSSVSRYSEIERYYKETREKCEEQGRTITALTAQLGSASEAAELQKHYEAQLKELRDQLRDGEGRYEAQLKKLGDQLRDYEDRTVPSLTSQMDELRHAVAKKADELADASKNLDQVRHDLTDSSSQNVSLQREVTTRTEELNAARKVIEQLKGDLSTLSTQIAEHDRRSTEFRSEVERLQTSDARKAEELIDARKKVDELRNDLSSLSSQNTKLRQDYEAQIQAFKKQLQVTLADKNTETATAHLNNEIERLRKEIVAKEKEVERLECTPLSHAKVDIAEVKDYDTVIKLTSTVDKWLRADAKRAEELARELAERNAENEGLRRNLITLKEIYIQSPELKQIFQSTSVELQQRHALEEQSRKLESALAERQSQLDGVQRFVATADTYADTALIQALQKLNAEVQQSTSFMADSITDNVRPRATQQTPERTSAVKRVSQTIGDALTGCLGSQDLDDVSLYLPIAFQAYLTCHLRWMISSWTTEKGYNDRIKNIYEQLQKSEAQTISGRWRSLTRAYISPTCLSDPETLASNTMEGLADMVVVAGFASSPSSAKSKVLSGFKGKVLSIIKIAGQFSKMIGEVVSADFEVLAANTLQKFEAATMEEDEVDKDKDKVKMGGTAVGQNVLCSTQLGMTKRVASAEPGKKDTLTVTVMKTKVILESSLAD